MDFASETVFHWWSDIERSQSVCLPKEALLEVSLRTSSCHFVERERSHFILEPRRGVETPLSILVLPWTSARHFVERERSHFILEPRRGIETPLSILVLPWSSPRYEQAKAVLFSLYQSEG
ncbi:hypothetical protein J6590_001238 [Homalodisca vitripennis]|nr:hypothetical protein J6590_001238 [Homalodisca vitripennis]